MEKKLEVLVDEVLQKPKKTTDDIFSLLASFIKSTLPPKIEPTNEIELECAVDIDKDDDYKEEIKLETHAEKVAVSLQSLNSSPQIQHLSHDVREHRTKRSFFTHSMKSRLRKSRSIHSSVVKKKGIIREICVKLKKKTINYKMHNDWQHRRKGDWDVFLDARELLKFKYE